MRKMSLHPSLHRIWQQIVKLKRSNTVISEVDSIMDEIIVLCNDAYMSGIKEGQSQQLTQEERQR